MTVAKDTFNDHAAHGAEIERAMRAINDMFESPVKPKGWHKLYKNLPLPPIRMTFGEIDGALAMMEGIAAHKRTAFRGRIKNLHRLGIVAPNGKGTTPHYPLAEYLRHALAVQMIQAGVQPERIARDIDFVWDVIMSKRGIQRVVERGAAHHLPPERLYLCYSGSWLDMLQAEPELPSARIVTADKLAMDPPRRALIINLTEMVETALICAVPIVKRSESDLAKEIMGWEAYASLKLSMRAGEA